MLFIYLLTFGFGNCHRAQYKSCRCRHTVKHIWTARETQHNTYALIYLYVHRNRIKMMNNACNTHIRPGHKGLENSTKAIQISKSLHLRGLKTKKGLKNYKLQLDMFLRYCTLLVDVLLCSTQNGFWHRFLWQMWIKKYVDRFISHIANTRRLGILQYNFLHFYQENNEKYCEEVVTKMTKYYVVCIMRYERVQLNFSFNLICLNRNNIGLLPGVSENDFKMNEMNIRIC